MVATGVKRARMNTVDYLRLKSEAFVAIAHLRGLKYVLPKQIRTEIRCGGLDCLWTDPEPPAPGHVIAPRYFQ